MTDDGDAQATSAMTSGRKSGALASDCEGEWPDDNWFKRVAASV